MAFADTRLQPDQRALLGARMAAFASEEVLALFTSFGARNPFFLERGEAPVLKIKMGMAVDALEVGVCAELHESQATTPQRLGRWLRRRLT